NGMSARTGGTVMADLVDVIRRFAKIAPFASAGLGAVAWAVPPPPLEITCPQTELDVTGPQQPVAAKALGDTVWIADWSFDGADGACNSAGWVKYDNRILNTHVDSDFWHVDNRFDGLTDGAVMPTQLIFNNAAILSRHDLCWAADGYGNNLDFSIKL